MHEHISREEFQGWMERLHGDVRECRDHLRQQNGRLGTVESAVKVLESQSAIAKDPAARWGAIGSALAALASGLFAWKA